MKIYNIFENIVKEEASCNLFSDRFGTSYYDGVMMKDLYYFVQKRIKGKIVWMSPDEYIETVAKIQHNTVADQLRFVRQDNVEMLLGKMKEGVKMDLPYIYFRGNSGEQEGRHRVIAAKKYGCISIPVGIFKDVTDGEILDIAIEIAGMEMDQAKQKLLELGFKNVDDYNMVNYTLNYLYEKFKNNK